MSSAQFFAWEDVKPMIKPHRIVVNAYMKPSNLNMIGSINEMISIITIIIAIVIEIERVKT